MAKIKINEVLRLLPKVNTVVHVGANDGAEVPSYMAAGAKNIVLFEPIDAIANDLKKKYPDALVYPWVLLDKDIDIDLHIAANNGASSSIYETPVAEMHHVEYTGKMRVHTKTLDFFQHLAYEDGIDLLVIDTQGADLKVLAGGVETLKSTEWILIEVSEKPLYKGACTFDQIDAFLFDNNFTRVGTFLNDRGTGDALYKRR